MWLVRLPRHNRNPDDPEGNSFLLILVTKIWRAPLFATFTSLLHPFTAWKLDLEVISNGSGSGMKYALTPEKLKTTNLSGC